MAWHVAESLERLLAQLNALAPNRSKVSDGSIGDEAHQKAGTSDHLPRVIAGALLVTARDFTTDPGGGLDCAKLRDALIKAKDSRVKYIIFNRQIISGAGGPSPWKARPYSGVNAHQHHLHLSVVGDKRCRDGSVWMLPGMADSPLVVVPAGDAFCKYGERSDNVMALQRFMTSAFPSYNAYRPTGFYGEATRDGVREFQKRTGITGADADGSIVGPRTLAKLREFGFQS